MAHFSSSSISALFQVHLLALNDWTLLKITDKLSRLIKSGKGKKICNRRYAVIYRCVLVNYSWVFLRRQSCISADLMFWHFALPTSKGQDIHGTSLYGPSCWDVSMWVNVKMNASDASACWNQTQPRCICSFLLNRDFSGAGADSWGGRRRKNHVPPAPPLLGNFSLFFFFFFFPNRNSN